MEIYAHTHGERAMTSWNALKVNELFNAHLYLRSASFYGVAMVVVEDNGGKRFGHDI
jgi:hypothetical protein